MIEEIKIKNFKSLADTTIKLKQFTCLVGMNGAGKTTILQALDFISQLMRGKMAEWMKNRGWSSKDLMYKGGGNHQKAPSTIIEVLYRLPDGDRVQWVGFFSRTKLQIIAERASLLGAQSALLLRTTTSSYYVDGNDYVQSFNYEGSILSALKDTILPAPLLLFRNALMNIRSLELLAPHLLRKRSRLSEDHIGVGGEKLPSFLDTIKGDAKDQLLSMLQTFYPYLENFRITTAKGGWKRLIVAEKRATHDDAGGLLLDTDAQHLNDGLLRVLAILAQSEANGANMLLLDEIENGINPEIVEKLVDMLVRSHAQIIVTTHSPMILNYFEDAVARDAVQFVYKSPEGKTNVRPFFSIPRIADKLRYMGPGEAFVDTDLNALTAQCVDLDQQDESALDHA